MREMKEITIRGIKEIEGDKGIELKSIPKMFKAPEYINSI